MKEGQRKRKSRRGGGVGVGAGFVLSAAVETSCLCRAELLRVPNGLFLFLCPLRAELTSCAATKAHPVGGMRLFSAFGGFLG